MSGICGVLRLDGGSADEGTLNAMLKAASHRGSDGRFSWANGSAALGHMASQAGGPSGQEMQPFASADRRWVIVADARIHNQREVRRKLVSAGHPPLASTGDASLILASYQCWGWRCVDHLIGDFAFAVWDRREGRLFAARDPLGMRPFYFHLKGPDCFFASEIQQLLAPGQLPRRLFRPMAAAWLLTRSGNPGWTFFDGVQQLPGGHALEVNARGSRIFQSWDIDPDRRLDHRREEDYLEELHDLLLTATGERLQGSGPVAMLLSGGLDSCAVAAAAGHLSESGTTGSSEPIRALSYRYEGFPECNEHHVSDQLAAHWRMPVADVSSEAWKPDFLLEHPPGLDSPVAAVFRPLQDEAMARAQAMGARQFLVAARGDNLMGGHLWDTLGLLLSGEILETFREIRAIRRSKEIPLDHALRNALVRPALKAFSRRTPGYAAARRERHLKVAMAGGAGPMELDPWIGTGLLAEAPGSELFWEPPLRPGADPTTLARAHAIFDPFTALGNSQNERRAAEFGLRCEDPWSDRRLVEFACATPAFLLNRVHEPKRLVRKALKRWAPPSVVLGARKILPAPFGAQALRRNESQSLRTLSTGMRLADAGLLDEGALADHIGDFLSGEPLRSGAWTAITLEAWMRAYEIEA